MNFLYSQENIKSILVIRLTSIGDVLLTTPLVRILGDLYPSARIDFLTTSQMADIFRYNPHIDNLFTVERHAKANELRLKKKEFFTDFQYDAVIDLQNNWKSAILRKSLSQHIFKFNKRRIFKLRLVYLKYKPVNYQLIPDLYIQTASELGTKPDGKGLEFWLDTETDKEFYSSNVEKKSNSNIIVIAPGAYHFTKRLPKEKFSELIGMLQQDGFEVTLIGGKEDVEVCNWLEHYASYKLHNLAGKLSLSESAKQIDTAKLVITNDTAVMHIASARKVPVIAIFGSTVREFGFLPYHSPYKRIEKEIPCRPCTHYGKKKCPKKHFNCMNLIESKDIYTSVKEMLLN